MNTEEMKKALKEWADKYNYQLKSSSSTIDSNFGDYIITDTTSPYVTTTSYNTQHPLQEVEERITRLEKKIKWLEMALATLLDGKELKDENSNNQ